MTLQTMRDFPVVDCAASTTGSSIAARGARGGGAHPRPAHGRRIGGGGGAENGPRNGVRHTLERVRETGARLLGSSSTGPRSRSTRTTTVGTTGIDGGDDQPRNASCCPGRWPRSARSARSSVPRPSPCAALASCEDLPHPAGGDVHLQPVLPIGPPADQRRLQRLRSRPWTARSAVHLGLRRRHRHRGYAMGRPPRTIFPRHAPHLHRGRDRRPATVEDDGARQPPPASRCASSSCPRRLAGLREPVRARLPARSSPSPRSSPRWPDRRR